MESTDGKLILYAVLNWGLGHATRSIQVIKALQQEGFEVLIASDGQALQLLKTTFPGLRTEKLPSYGIRYSRSSNQLLKLATQLPGMCMAVRRERKALKKLVAKYSPAGLISDNRLGWYHSDLPSVYITHQLRLITPFAPALFSSLHHVFINRYDQCWIPDNAAPNDLAGQMVHNKPSKQVRHFIGPLSQFYEADRKKFPKEYDIAIVLSGPEPQRSILEAKLVSEVPAVSSRSILIRGTEEGPELNVPDSMEVISMAGSAKLMEVILSSDQVISRSGYSSVMDYYFLGNRALLIPTPGQPEQEYLARYQLHRGRFNYASQDYLNLKEELEKAQNFEGFVDRPLKAPDWGELFSLFKGKGEG